MDVLSHFQLRSVIEDDFMKISIFYESKTVKEVIETPLMSLGALLSNLGGAIGFYLGISVIALFEVVELIARYVKKGLCLFCPKKSKE